MDTNELNLNVKLTPINWFKENNLNPQVVNHLYEVRFDGHYFLIYYNPAIDLAWKQNDQGLIAQVCYFVNKNGNWYGGPFINIPRKTILVDCHDLIYKAHDKNKPNHNDLVAVCLLNMDNNIRTNYCYTNWK